MPLCHGNRARAPVEPAHGTGNLSLLGTSSWIPVRVAAIFAVAFLATASRLVVDGRWPGERWVLQRLHLLVGTSLDDPMLLVREVTDTGAVAVGAAVVFVVLWFRARRQDARWFLVAVAVVLLVNPVLKELFGRPRPDVRPPPGAVSSLSFPSGHASATAAFLGALLLVVHGPRLRRLVVIVGAAVVVIVAFSNLVLTVHYPSDIVGGWAWSGAWVAVVWSMKRHHDAAASRRRS